MLLLTQTQQRQVAPGDGWLHVVPTVFLVCQCNSIYKAHLGDIAGSVPDHRKKASITIKQVAIFLMVAFKIVKNVVSVKCNQRGTMKQGVPRIKSECSNYNQREKI